MPNDSQPPVHMIGGMPKDEKIDQLRDQRAQFYEESRKRLAERKKKEEEEAKRKNDIEMANF